MPTHPVLWTPDKEALLHKWFPHFGARSAYIIGLTGKQVKHKADKINLRLLPKQERLCVKCRARYQVSRRDGLYCHDCYLWRRKEVKAHRPKPLRRWIGDITRTARHRSTVPSDLTIDYMVSLWEKQNGKCFYSGISMTVPQYRDGRNPLSASIDQIDPSKGYIKGNVVWATWICNAGKSDLAASEYVALCGAVVDYASTHLVAVLNVDVLVSRVRCSIAKSQSNALPKGVCSLVQLCQVGAESKKV